MAKDIAKFYFERNNGMDYTVKLLGLIRHAIAPGFSS